jgi:hypothetical protein
MSDLAQSGRSWPGPQDAPLVSPKILRASRLRILRTVTLPGARFGLIAENSPYLGLAWC